MQYDDELMLWDSVSVEIVSVKQYFYAILCQVYAELHLWTGAARRGDR